MIRGRETGMKLTLTFSPETEARLRARAAASGRDIESVVHDAVEQTLNTTGGTLPRAQSTGTGSTLRDLVSEIRAFSPVNDGWGGAVDEAVRLGNQPPSAGSPWDS